jgi:hypothetical protein
MKLEIVSRIIAAIEGCQLVVHVGQAEWIGKDGFKFSVHADILGEKNPDTGCELTIQDYYNYLINSMPEDIQKEYAFALVNGFYDSGVAIITVATMGGN